MSRSRCKSDTPFKPLHIAVLTVSDSRTSANDTSGDTPAERVQLAGHVLADRKLLPDDIFKLRAAVSTWIADESIDCILVTGGTGITGSNSTPEAIAPLLVRDIPGFGELFRYYSLEEIQETRTPTILRAESASSCSERRQKLLRLAPGWPGFGVCS